MSLLRLTSKLRIRPEGINLIARAYNEARLLPEFLEHYRKLAEGNISFLIIDDYSTDGTNALLSAQPDVTLYRPIRPMMYKMHREEWIVSLLNLHGNGKWCLTPDADEHLVYRNMETKPLRLLIAEMTREKANTLPAIMLDMYGARPLASHTYKGAGLRQEFPLFDALDSYRVRRLRHGFIEAIGGLRQRLFYPDISMYRKRYFGISVNDFTRPERDRFYHRISDSVKKRLRRLHSLPFIPPPLNAFKTPLFLWTNGMEWTAHGNRSRFEPILHRKLAALLHYHLARGVLHYQQVALRRQNLFKSGPLNHAHIAISHDWSQINPVYDMSKTYMNSHSVFDEPAEQNAC